MYVCFVILCGIYVYENWRKIGCKNIMNNKECYFFIYIWVDKWLVDDVGRVEVFVGKCIGRVLGEYWVGVGVWCYVYFCIWYDVYFCIWWCWECVFCVLCECILYIREWDILGVWLSVVLCVLLGGSSVGCDVWYCCLLCLVKCVGVLFFFVCCVCILVWLLW